MSLSRDLASGTTNSELEAVDTYTTTQTSPALDVTNRTGIALVTLHSKEGTGNADNTLDVKLQESTTSGGAYTDITGATFTQVDDTAGGAIEGIAVDMNKVKGFIKAVGTIAGTTPSFIYGVTVAARKEVI